MVAAVFLQQSRCGLTARTTNYVDAEHQIDRLVEQFGSPSVRRFHRAMIYSPRQPVFRRNPDCQVGVRPTAKTSAWDVGHIGLSYPKQLRLDDRVGNFVDASVQSKARRREQKKFLDLWGRPENMSNA